MFDNGCLAEDRVCVIFDERCVTLITLLAAIFKATFRLSLKSGGWARVSLKERGPLFIYILRKDRRLECVLVAVDVLYERRWAVGLGVACFVLVCSMCMSGSRGGM